ncbi:MAG: hypothetical protein IJA57_00310 [Alistipes sp.]|nr:hypothetical protein [Alistipes sp.]
MEAIKALLGELRRCEILNDYKEVFSYNGITLEESSVAFQKRLHCLYEDALVEIPLLTQDAKDGFANIIDKYAESQRLFDVPDESILESMNREIEAGNTNVSLKKERDFVKMICECVSLQKYYLNEFAAAIGYTPTEQESEQPSIMVDDEPIADDDANQEWVYGYKGIMSAFKWGRNKVAKFLKDSFYEEAIVREGDKIAVNVPKARELMQKKERERKNPKRRRC